MAAPAKRMTAMDARSLIPTWKTETLGWTKDVDPSGLELLTRDKIIGELDDIVIDKEIYGVQGVVRMTLHEVDSERMRQLCPWAAATGAFSIAPTTGAYSMYANAGPLVLHPKGVSGTAQDQAFAKAFPMFKLPKGAGAKVWRELPVDFWVFMDQDALVDAVPTAVAAYVGPLPA
jgi:hypothetical protein